MFLNLNLNLRNKLNIIIFIITFCFATFQTVASNETVSSNKTMTSNKVIEQPLAKASSSQAIHEKGNIKSSLFATTTWWKKRNKQQDIFYPHKAHYQVMDKMQDSCMLCHSFNGNNVNGAKMHDTKKLKAFTAIVNEPMKAVCHSCHVEEKTAPATCSLCHTEKTDIWPADHNINYLQSHGIDAKHNEQACDSCHLSKQFCSDCHFRRQPRGGIFHPLGFLGRHGSEVQFNPSECGTCHNQQYCTDCHRRKSR